MTARSLGTLVALLVVPAMAVAQHNPGAGSAPVSRTAPREARQFDFLIGQWELTVTPKAEGLAARIHGAPRLVGTWKAWRALDGWGIEDELRIMDGSGNPMSLTHSIRGYDATAQKWTQATYDAYRTRFTNASAEWKGAEMTVTSRGTDADGKAYVNRMVFSGITADAFKARQDRSVDDGKTWEQGVLRIEAKRVAASASR